MIRTRARTNLIIAAAVWIAVGTGLGTAGLVWLSLAKLVWWQRAGLLGAGVAMGLIKARTAMARAARRTADRILTRGDGHVVFTLYSLPTWLLVFAMMGLGMTLRRVGTPRPLLGLIYVMVGVALTVGSRTYVAALGDGRGEEAHPRGST